jgi:protein-S-isoprenylcysteine O-methyltransferase Ste14
MKATDFEFRHRALINVIHFGLAFSAYAIDRTNIVQGAVQSTIGSESPHAHVFVRGLFAAGALLVGLASALRTWAAAYLRSDVVHDPNLRADTLIADGPYRYVRNPLYLGTFLLALGLGLLASRLGFVVLVGGMILRGFRLIGREQAELEEQQGEGFREFCRRVPQLIPSLHPRVAPRGLKPRWGQAFTGEFFMWGFFGAMLLCTVTLDMKLAGLLIGAILLVHYLQRFIRKFGRQHEDVSE